VYGFHPRELDTLTLSELWMFIDDLDAHRATDPNGGA